MQAARLVEKAISKVLVTTTKPQNEKKDSLVKTIKLADFQVQNMVATCDVGFCIKLESLREMHQKFRSCHYEPELFPGLNYFIDDE